MLGYELLEDRRLLTAVVLSTSPLSASTSVPIDSSIEATFDSPISPMSVTDQSFVVHRQQSGQLLSSSADIASLTSVGTLVTLDPAANFYPGEIVQVTATASLLDDSSLAVAPYVWDFRAATAGGSGTFIDSGQSLSNTTGWHVALGDADNDGDLDAFVTNLQASGLPNPDSRLWLNQGGLQSGTEGQFVDSGQSLENSRPHDLALGDLDGDGDLDVFYGNSSGRPNTIWFNQGGLQGGTEGLFVDSGQKLGGAFTRGVSLGDLDGDGDLDAFVANRSDQPNRVWFNQGGKQAGTPGQFQDSGQLLGISTSFDVTLGDLDGDGDLDAFVVNDDAQANRVWVNDGLGIFTDSGQLLGNSSSRAVALGDLDLDGDLDAFVGNATVNFVWLNQGGAQGGTAGQFANSGQTVGNTGLHDVSLGDLDGDGDLDAFVANLASNANTVWINQGGKQGGAAGQFIDSGQSLGSSTSHGVALGDLDNDGDLDAFVVNRGVGEPDLVWLNQDPSADFDLDSDVDGTDFLTWQRSFGTTFGAVLAEGDADANGAVNGADLAVWESQMGTGALLLAASFVNPNNPISTTGVTPVTSIPAIRQPESDFNVSWVFSTSYREVASQMELTSPGMFRITPRAIQPVDRAREQLFDAYDLKAGDAQKTAWVFPKEDPADVEPRALARITVAITEKEERINTALAEWYGCRASICSEEGRLT